MFKKCLLASVLSLALVGNVLAQDAEAETEASGPWEVTADVDLTSDYVFRGVSQSQEQAALQAGLTFEHESGFYAGLWGSSVDFTDSNTAAADEDGANVEIDVSLGYGFDIADKWTGDVQVVRYVYPGLERDIDYSYNELIGSVTFNEMITGTVGYANNVFATDEAGIYVGVSAEYPLPWWDLSLTGEVGNYDIDGGYDDGSDFDYTHWGLGISKSFGIVNTSLAWANTDHDGQDYYGEIADSRVFLTIGISTGL